MTEARLTDQEIQERAERFEELLDEALRLGGGTHTRQNVVDQIQANQAKVWFSLDNEGVVISERRQYPSGLILANGWLGAGKFESILTMKDELEDYARASGAHGVTMTVAKAHRAWLKHLPDFRLMGYHLRKDFE